MTSEEYAKNIKYNISSPDINFKKHLYKVSIKNLDSWFGNKQALKNINFDIKENTITALVGPS